MLRITRSTLLTALGLAVLAAAGTATTAEAQFGRRLKDAVKRTAEDKAIQKTTDEESKAIDSATSAGGTNTAAPAVPAPAANAPPANAPAPVATPSTLTAAYVVVHAYMEDLSSVVLRFDGGEPSDDYWSVSNDNTALFAPDPLVFVGLGVRGIQKAQCRILRVELV